MWKTLFIVVLATDVSLWGYALASGWGELGSLDFEWWLIVPLAVGVAFLIPQYVALYLYGHRSPQLWKNEADLS